MRRVVITGIGIVSPFGRGVKANWEDGLLKLMDGLSDRTAYFKEAIAYCEPGKEPIVFEGITMGKIDTKKSGTYGWSWDFVFIPEGEEKT